MKKISILLICAVCAMMFSSCNVYTHSMKDPNANVELYAADFEFSGPVTGEATVTKILGVDWERLLGEQKMGSTPEVDGSGLTSSGFLSSLSIPVIGNYLKSHGADYAIYDMMQKNPGYDVVFYPQVEAHKTAPLLGSDVFSTTTYKVTARLGKLKKK